MRSGTEPVEKLPEASFHRWLDAPLGCPKCDVSYNLVVDWEWANTRFFDDEVRGSIRLLTKAIFMGHGTDHHVTHYETAGVVVKSFLPQPKPVTKG